jgi:hypothetical protein
MFVDKDEYQMTSWQRVAKEGRIEVLHKLWECAKNLLKREELNNNFLN